MSRSGYSDDYCGDSNYPPEFYYQAVKRAITGSRGQAFLQELATAMDAMPEKILIADELVTKEGDCCAMGVICKARGIDTSKIDYEDRDSVGAALNIAPSMAGEIAFHNDDDFSHHSGESPEQRWVRMRKWVDTQLQKESNV